MPSGGFFKQQRSSPGAQGSVSKTRGLAGVTLWSLACPWNRRVDTRVSLNRKIRPEFGMGVAGEKPKLLFPRSKPFHQPLN